MSDAFTRPTTLAFGWSGPVVASRSRLVVVLQPLAMSQSCVLTTSLTQAASAYLIFGIFGLTAKQPLLSTHRANGKQYSTWVDVEHAMKNNLSVSIMVLGFVTSWQCHVLVHISIDQLVEPVIDDVGFLYNGLTFENEKKVYDETKGVMSFALMLPHQDKEGYLRYCLLDKDWRFIQCDR
jgi:hypothetical protein